MVDFGELKKDLRQGGEKRETITATLAGEERELLIRPLIGPEGDDIYPVIADYQEKSELTDDELELLQELEGKREDDEETLTQEEEEALEELKEKAADQDFDREEFFRAVRLAGARGLTVSKDEANQEYKENTQDYRGMSLEAVQERLDEELTEEVLKSEAARPLELFRIGKEVLELESYEEGK